MLASPEIAKRTRCPFGFCCHKWTPIPSRTLDVSLLFINGKLEEPDCWWSQRAANAANDPGEQSTWNNDIGFNFEQPSNHVSHIYWMKVKTGSNWNTGERSGPSRSHIMRETHSQKQRKTASTRYPKGTSKKTKYKRLAPKDGSLTPSIYWARGPDVQTREHATHLFKGLFSLSQIPACILYETRTSALNINCQICLPKMMPGTLLLRQPHQYAIEKWPKSLVENLFIIAPFTFD